METSDFELSALRNAISVSTMLARARQALDRALPLCWVSGEIAGFKQAPSGHCYFDLKDSSAQMACVLFRNRAVLLGVALKDGAQVELRVRPSIYEPRGSLQFTVEQARLAGVGRLYEAFLQLKAQLTAEGVFDEARKRPLPRFPRRIGLITSAQAAALADILRVLRDRWPIAEIILYPASVQGTNAARELLAALNTANQRAECEVLIMGRGGGSLEDLWAFNDEALTRAVAASHLPIVSAIGHETDFSLVDFAADLRAATPSVAAAMVSPERDVLLQQFAQLQQRSQAAFRYRLEHWSQRIDRVNERLRNSANLLAPWREHLLRLHSRLARAHYALTSQQHRHLLYLQQRLARQIAQALPARSRIEQLARTLQQNFDVRLKTHRQRLTHAAQALALLNPQQVLDRGYAVILDSDGHAVTEAARVTPGSLLRLRLKRGELDAQVLASHNDAAQPINNRRSKT